MKGIDSFFRNVSFDTSFSASVFISAKETIPYMRGTIDLLYALSLLGAPLHLI